jgi:hypothetical protein
MVTAAAAASKQRSKWARLRWLERLNDAGGTGIQTGIPSLERADGQRVTDGD